MEFFRQLLSRDFTPYGFCYLWGARVVWLHVIADGLITLSLVLRVTSLPGRIL